MFSGSQSQALLLLLNPQEDAQLLTFSLAIFACFRAHQQSTPEPLFYNFPYSTLSSIPLEASNYFQPRATWASLPHSVFLCTGSHLLIHWRSLHLPLLQFLPAQFFSSLVLCFLPIAIAHYQFNLLPFYLH